MKFTAITTILSFAALALAAPSVEVAARGGGGATNAFASSCQQANGVAYCCNTVEPGSEFGNLVPLNANVLTGCLDLLLNSPQCSNSNICCNGPATNAPSLVSVLDNAQLCTPINL